MTDVIPFVFQGPEEVRAAMERSEIYLVTSDRKEGWGAVVNEAMNSGCAVVADHMIGAAPWLIRQGENGWMYRDGEEQELFRTVERLQGSRRVPQTGRKRTADHCRGMECTDGCGKIDRTVPENEVLARNVRRTGNAGCRPGCDAGHHNICPDSTIME